MNDHQDTSNALAGATAANGKATPGRPAKANDPRLGKTVFTLKVPRWIEHYVQEQNKASQASMAAIVRELLGEAIRYRLTKRDVGRMITKPSRDAIDQTLQRGLERDLAPLLQEHQASLQAAVQAGRKVTAQDLERLAGLLAAQQEEVTALRREVAAQHGAATTQSKALVTTMVRGMDGLWANFQQDWRPFLEQWPQFLEQWARFMSMVRTEAAIKKEQK